MADIIPISRVSSRVSNISIVRTLAERTHNPWIKDNIRIRRPFLEPGQRSLHLASGISSLPIAEAVLGLNVTVTDIDKQYLGLAERAACRHLRGAGDHRDAIGKLTFMKLDIFGDLYRRFSEDWFHHVTMTDFFKINEFSLLSYQALFERGRNITAEILISVRDGGTLTLTADGSLGSEFSMWDVLNFFASKGLRYKIIGRDLPNADGRNDSMILQVSKSPELRAYLEQWDAGEPQALDLAA